MLRGLGLVQRLDVLLAEHLEDELVAQPAGRVAGARLALAEDRELHAGHVQQLGERLGGLLRAVLEGAGAADPEQVLDLGQVLDGVAEHRAPRSRAPRSSPAAARAFMPHGLPLFSRFFSIVPGLGRERRLDQHLVAAHVDDVVDVLDVDRALLDAGAAGGAGPQHVRVDDAALLGGADQRAVGLRLPGSGDPAEAGLRYAAVRRASPSASTRASPSAARCRLVLGSQQVRRLGEQVVAQVHDHELGRERLAGVPGRALRLAAAALGAGGEVEHALPGEVLDLAAAEDVVLVSSSCPRSRSACRRTHRQQRAERVRLALGQHVDRREGDVQVLGVDDDDQEAEDHGDLRAGADRLDHLVGVGAQRVEQRARWPATRTPTSRRPEREGAGVDLRAAVERAASG